ncbi:hypothetical protein NET03_04200 [Thermomicrobium sp. CFH 73360]|uniref:hypothetical protein n=1 Tax=Thermomicrobium sp. CFH 73360 TaxID=2951987 RepID=UPI0020770990|nr:hypothetical protein [Thermomicrobium sp. CFH 73360]MCM8745723.1 hypothetical protein [Thermomicrobium sp. CFH 73360]
MGYCPRCGEHSPYREDDLNQLAEFPPVRIPIGSRIVPLPADLEDGAMIRYAGCLFTVRRSGDRYELLLARVGHS